MNNFSDKANFIWGIADLIRDTFKRGKYQDVILPFTVLRRIDSVLEPTRDKVVEAYQQYGSKLSDPTNLLCSKSGYAFYNISPYTFERLLNDAPNLAANLRSYINDFSPNMREVLEKFGFENTIKELDEANLLYAVMERFKKIDLHPDKVSNHEMGYIFEELIRKFNEALNENPGEHFTPREVIRLMVDLSLTKDPAITQTGIVRKVYDPCCGSGGMLTAAKERIVERNATAHVYLYGQEVNKETFAICKSDLYMKSKDGRDAENMLFGSTLSDDRHEHEQFHFIFANPPYGKDWKRDEADVKAEASKGSQSRFGAGLPRINDGQLLFLQNMLFHMYDAQQDRSQVAIVMNGSPLFTGDAGSGESEIRRWILEHDWLEAIVALPEQLFYNTGIATYVWLLTNQKSTQRKGKVQLINATDIWVPMRKSMGDKRRAMTDEQIEYIRSLFTDFAEGERVKIFPHTAFGYRKITIERPLRLNFQISPERLARLDEQKAFTELAISKKKAQTEKAADEEAGMMLQQVIRTALGTISSELFTDRALFEQALDNALKPARLRLAPAVRKAILNALSERDETADICRDEKGRPEADPELRDTESIPLPEDGYEVEREYTFDGYTMNLGESVIAFFEREVRPYVPDAWINPDVRDAKDDRIGKVGYEINFNRYFYKYQLPRPLHEIEADIKQIERNILELLHEVERHTTIINQTVTRGLNPDVSMKDSGIEWLGEVPEHWEVKRLKFIADVLPGVAKGKNLNEKKVIDLPYLRVANVQDGHLNLADVHTITVGIDEVDHYLLKVGDVLMNEGGDFDKLGRGAVWDGSISPCLHQNHVFAVRPFNISNSAWISTITQTSYAKYYFILKSKQSTNLASISKSNIQDLPVILPPVEERKLILEYINQETAKIDRLISEIQEGIKKVKEYSTALTSAAVTGKIDVRGEIVSMDAQGVAD